MLRRMLTRAHNMASAVVRPALPRLPVRAPVRTLTARVQASYQPDDTPSRAFTSFAVYKGKAAVAMKVITPTYKELPASQGFRNYVVDREGVMLLEFANVMPQQGGQGGYGARSYDWQNKVSFAVKAIELAALVDLDHTGDQPVEFFHDPNKGNEQPGQVKITKSLKFAPAQQGGGYMMSITQKSGATNTYVTVPITRAEYVVLKKVSDYVIPRLMGFDQVFDEPLGYPNILPLGQEESAAMAHQN